MVRSASRNRSFRYAARETSRGLKPRARGWPLARYRRIAWPPSTCRAIPSRRSGVARLAGEGYAKDARATCRPSC